MISLIEQPGFLRRNWGKLALGGGVAGALALGGDEGASLAKKATKTITNPDTSVPRKVGPMPPDSGGGRYWNKALRNKVGAGPPPQNIASNPPNVPTISNRINTMVKTGSEYLDKGVNKLGSAIGGVTKRGSEYLDKGVNKLGSAIGGAMKNKAQESNYWDNIRRNTPAYTGRPNIPNTYRV